MSLELVLSETKALVVPEEAIVVQAADTFVFLIDDGKANRTSVTTGMRKDGVIVVSSGLAEGQQVVIRGLQRVRDKGAVKIKGAASAQSGKQKPRS
jgi:membrane fusion protein (multidrug efflux system)